MIDNSTLKTLHNSLSGDVLFDNLHKTLYATDASVYRKIPLAVAFPKDQKDIKTLIEFATLNTITLIPRTAGTSLAGQCVGDQPGKHEIQSYLRDTQPPRDGDSTISLIKQKPGARLELEYGR